MQELKRYYTGKPCKFQHIAERNTNSGLCCECTRLRHYDYYANNKEQALVCISDWQSRNKDVVNANTLKWRNNHPNDAINTHKRYYEAHKTTKLLYNKQWREANKPLLQFYNLKRRKQLVQATPAWADQLLILEFYKNSVELTNQTGIPHQVDHIIPLVNDLVCGLHWEGNLQVLTAVDNQSKNNKFVI